MDWKRSPIVAVIAGIVIIITAAAIVLFILSKPRYVTTLMCEDTGTVFEMKLPADAKFPVKCPDSGRNTAYLAIEYTCQEHGHTFFKPATPALLPGAEREMPGEELAMTPPEVREKIGSLIRCPICGSTNVKGEFYRKAE